MVEAFLQAIDRDDPSQVTDPEEALESHGIVFAAERSRHARPDMRLEARDADTRSAVYTGGGTR